MTLLTAAELTAMNDTLAELANCTITEVARPGRLAANGDSTPTATWRGSISGFRSRERRTVVRGGVQQDEIVETVRIFDAEGGPTAYTAAGDALAHSIVIDGRRWTIRGAERDADGTLDSWLLELDQERAA